MKLAILVAVCLFLAVSGSTIKGSHRRHLLEVHAEWGYEHWDGEGIIKPAHWGEVNENCDGSKQSPIDLAKDSAKRATFQVTRNENLNGNWKNNGHAPTITLNSDSIVELTSGEDKFRLQQFHFHFGCEKGRGSEHTVDGEAFEGELHFVFWNKKFGSFANAADKPNGLTVFGVFLKEEEDGENEELETIMNQLGKITYAGSEHTTENGIDMTGLAKQLFKENTKYYSYSGSLTTPPCYESVNWRVLAKPLKVTHNQLKEFRKLLRSEENKPEEKMCDNYRPVQTRE